MFSEAITVLAIIIIIDLIYQLFFKRINREEPLEERKSPPKKPDTKIGKEQFTQEIQEIIDKELYLFGKDILIDEKSRIPETGQIPIQNPIQWIKIHEVICCFVDMKGSTKLSASMADDEEIAKIYRLFTETAIRIFSEFKSPYIDVKGDGVFALFDSDKPHIALAATISFKTFVYEHFTPRIQTKAGHEVSGHFGIDQDKVLVRKLGLKRYRYRTDRQNEVWAGQPINMAAKLANLSQGDEILISPRFFKNLNLQDFGAILHWHMEDISSDNRFSFNNVYVLRGNWPRMSGELYCRKLIQNDKPQRVRDFVLSVYSFINFWKSKS